MVPVRENPTGDRKTERALVELKRESEVAPPPLMERIIPPVPTPPPMPGTAQLICGACQTPIEQLGGGFRVRCARCNRSLKVPAFVRVKCGRCGNHQHVRPRELGMERLCAKCGKELLIPNLTLTPHHHPRARRAKRHHGSAHADAAWAVMILGLTLLVAVLALTVL
jgi:LSD1 subclass zinc finger protein